MAGIMRRYLKVLLSGKRKQQGSGAGRTTARQPVWNGTGFEDEGCDETVRQSRVERISEAPQRADTGIQTGMPFRLVREITFLHSDVEIT